MLCHTSFLQISTATALLLQPRVLHHQFVHDFYYHEMLEAASQSSRKCVTLITTTTRIFELICTSTCLHTTQYLPLPLPLLLQGRKNSDRGCEKILRWLHVRQSSSSVAQTNIHGNRRGSQRCIGIAWCFLAKFSVDLKRTWPFTPQCVGNIIGNIINVTPITVACSC